MEFYFKREQPPLLRRLERPRKEVKVEVGESGRKKTKQKEKNKKDRTRGKKTKKEIGKALECAHLTLSSFITLALAGAFVATSSAGNFVPFTGALGECLANILQPVYLFHEAAMQTVATYFKWAP